MKKISSVLLIGLLALSFTACDNFDDPNLENIYGNNSIGEPNITVAKLKQDYASTITASGLKQVTEDIRVEGIIVGDDESGNIYKQLILKDSTGSIIVGINTTGIYAYCPTGQKVRINCKGLYVGGYSKQAQIGTNYGGSIGRMDFSIWKEHVRLIGKPSLTYEELTPVVINSQWLKDTKKDDAPFLVTLKDVTILEGNGEATFAPDAEKDGGNGVSRNIVLDDNSKLTLRTSSYSNFSTEIIPSEKVTITGVLSQFKDSWQIVMRTYDDLSK